jgi:hypothetical protein
MSVRWVREEANGLKGLFSLDVPVIESPLIGLTVGRRSSRIASKNAATQKVCPIKVTGKILKNASLKQSFSKSE